MTVYVLHGGKMSVVSPKNDEFFRQFSELVDKAEIEYLMCYWARPREQWQSLIERDVHLIKKQTNKTVVCEWVNEPADLKAKIDKADGLYVAGGDAQPIEKYYQDCDFLRDDLKGKVYLGSSMGAFFASKYYILSMDDQDEKTVHRGLGLLQVNTLCHWNLERKKGMKINLLKEKDPKTPIITLNEQEFVTFYQ